MFEDFRLASLYDAFEGTRTDLEVYVQVAEQLGARRVADVGCGTGSFALLLAQRGLEVIGVDPAAASLAVARAKPRSDGVCWVHGDATALPPFRLDLVASPVRTARSALR